MKTLRLENLASVSVPSLRAKAFKRGEIVEVADNVAEKLLKRTTHDREDKTIPVWVEVEGARGPQAPEGPEVEINPELNPADTGEGDEGNQDGQKTAPLSTDKPVDGKDSKDSLVKEEGKEPAKDEADKSTKAAPAVTKRSKPAQRSTTKPATK